MIHSLQNTLFITKTIYPAIELIIIAAIRKSFCGMQRGNKMQNENRR